MDTGRRPVAQHTLRKLLSDIHRILDFRANRQYFSRRTRLLLSLSSLPWIAWTQNLDELPPDWVNDQLYRLDLASAVMFEEAVVAKVENRSLTVGVQPPRTERRHCFAGPVPHDSINNARLS